MANEAPSVKRGRIGYPLRVVRRRGRHRSLAAWLGSGALVGSLLFACLGATQIIVEGQTDVACADVLSTAFYVAAPGAPIGAGSPSATSSTCDPATGSLGTLTVVPAGDNEGAVRITLVLGVDRPADRCSPDAPEPGCIVARRTLRYAAHRTQRVPIFLATACLGVRCADGQTCAQGVCVSSACTGESCANVDPAAPPVGTPPQRPDAAGPTDAGTDATIAVLSDSASPLPPGGGPAGAGRVACPAKAGGKGDCDLTLGEACCAAPQMQCITPLSGQLCTGGSPQFRCDDARDCAAPQDVCCLRLRSATCSTRDACTVDRGTVLCALADQCQGTPCGPSAEVPSPYWACGK